MNTLEDFKQFELLKPITIVGGDNNSSDPEVDERKTNKHQIKL
ncbi:hypothetical protein [Winogradskyella sp.]|nr:hypothetical protein [Winogradskyella sp.]